MIKKQFSRNTAISLPQLPAALAVFMCAMLLAATSMAAQSATVVFSQPAPRMVDPISLLSTRGGETQLVADNFVLDNATHITGLRWWGDGRDPDNVRAYQIEVYDNNASGGVVFEEDGQDADRLCCDRMQPSTIGAPGDLLKKFEVSRNDSRPVASGRPGEFIHRTDLHKLHLEGGVSYWLSIIGLLEDPDGDPWLWTTLNNIDRGADLGDLDFQNPSTLGTFDWTQSKFAFDVAFELEGVEAIKPVPLPPAAFLLALGLVILGAHAKRSVPATS